VPSLLSLHTKLITVPSLLSLHTKLITVPSLLSLHTKLTTVYKANYSAISSQPAYKANYSAVSSQPAYKANYSAVSSQPAYRAQLLTVKTQLSIMVSSLGVLDVWTQQKTTLANNPYIVPGVLPIRCLTAVWWFVCFITTAVLVTISTLKIRYSVSGQWLTCSCSSWVSSLPAGKLEGIIAIKLRLRRSRYFHMYIPSYSKIRAWCDKWARR
jgi:hypothetical protein